VFSFGPNGIQDEISLTRKTKLSINALAQLLPPNYRFVISCTPIIFLCITLITAVTTPLQGKTLAAPTNLQVTITVDAAPPTNQLPTVSAGFNQTITRPASASLSGTAFDDGLPSGSTLTTTWSKSSGPGTVAFGNIHALSTTASFSTSGTYMLQLAATDGALTATSSVTITVDAAQAQWSVAYTGPYGGGTVVSAIDWRALTHIINDSVKLNEDGTVTQINGNPSTIITAAHTAGVKVLLGIDMNSAIATAVQNQLSTSVSNIMAVVNSYGYDGVDVDWEIGYSATENTTFLTALRSALGALLLTEDVQVYSATYWGNNYSLVDRINLMTYQLPGGVDVYSWFNSPLGGGPSHFSNITQCIGNYTNAGVPPGKMNLGIPFWGLNSTGGSPVVTGPGQTFGTVPTITLIRYRDILTTYDISSPTWDSTGQVPWIPIKNGWLSFDNAESVTAKIQWARANNLGGWMVNSLEDDYLAAGTPKHPLLDAVKRALTVNSP